MKWPNVLTIPNMRYYTRTGYVMVSVFASSVEERMLESWSGQTNDYEIGICRFSAKHTTFKRNSKDWLARNQDNVSV
jgi:hypothetical protein